MHIEGLLRRLPVFALVATAAVLLAPGAAHALQAGLQVAQGPYYVGVPIDVQVIAEGFEEEPQPEVSAETPAGTKLDFVTARPQVSSMVQIVNGQITQRKEVRYAFAYRFTAAAPGRYTLGPFEVVQGERRATSRTVSFNVGQVPLAEGQRLRVLLPKEPVFIGQRVPVTVEWWTEAGLADRLYNQSLQVPLFLDASKFLFLDDSTEASRVHISADTANGPVEFPADVRQEVRDGRQWVVRSFTRTLVPVVAGAFDLGPATLHNDEAIGWRRDFFGSRVPTQVRKQRLASAPISLKVNPVPARGRPKSYAGAIGSGFSLEVTADRTVVQTGDPVRLTFTLRGDGSLEAASLPPLAASGLSAREFRLPAGEVAGHLEPDAKRFEVTVRVADASVREVPAIEYSRFDPATGSFETTRSQPIALSVTAATVVGAGDVVSAAPAAPREAESEAAPDSRPAASAPAFTLTGADLSVETNLARLRSPLASPVASPVFVSACYGGGLMLLAGAAWVHRRRSIDPVRERRAKEMSAHRSRVASAAAAREVAEALRRMTALHTGARADDLDDVLAALDEVVYAPGGAEAGVPDELRERAVAAADALAEGSR
jgi:hypothetical protein